LPATWCLHRRGTKFYFAGSSGGFNMASGSAKLLTQLVGLAECPPARPVGQTIDGKEAFESAWAGELAGQAKLRHPEVPEPKGRRWAPRQQGLDDASESSQRRGSF